MTSRKKMPKFSSTIDAVADRRQSAEFINQTFIVVTVTIELRNCPQ